MTTNYLVGTIVFSDGFSIATQLEAGSNGQVLVANTATASGFEFVNPTGGPAGPAGPAGPEGPLGPIGPTGPTGDKGPTGNTGAVGQQGAPGATGPTGAKGPVGDKGAAGDKGATGDKGPTGDVGPQGPTGATGAKGEVGNKGPTGDTGPTGDKGEKGDEGDPGPRGPTGFQGQQGNEGPAGPRGPTGFTGDKGLKGDNGDAGPTGPTGATGAVGERGPTGPKGATGDPGPQGTAGANGQFGITVYNDDSARNIALPTPYQGQFTFQLNSQLLTYWITDFSPAIVTTVYDWNALAIGQSRTFSVANRVAITLGTNMTVAYTNFTGANDLVEGNVTNVVNTGGRADVTMTITRVQSETYTSTTKLTSTAVESVAGSYFLTSFVNVKASVMTPNPPVIQAGTMITSVTTNIYSAGVAGTYRIYINNIVDPALLDIQRPISNQRTLVGSANAVTFDAGCFFSQNRTITSILVDASVNFNAGYPVGGSFSPLDFAGFFSGYQLAYTTGRLFPTSVSGTFSKWKVYPQP